MNYGDLDFFQEKARQCTAIEDLKPVCAEFSSSVAFEFYLFGVVEATSLSAPKITTVTNYPDEWWLYYFKEEMQKCDPVVRYCFERSAPIRWDKLMEMEEYMSPAAERMMAKSSSFGLSYGVSIPIKSSSGEVAIFSLASSNAENLDDRFLAALPYAQALSYALLEAYIRLKIESAERHNLTPREKECLFWACEGKTAWEISKIVEISERTVIFHMTSATKKLDAVNRQHAVAKAIMLGLIKPVP